jgi:hypothetical protein
MRYPVWRPLDRTVRAGVDLRYRCAHPLVCAASKMVGRALAARAGMQFNALTDPFGMRFAPSSISLFGR